MDERAIKRLLIIVAASIIVIFLFKAMMSKTIVNLNKAAAEKQQAAKPPAAEVAPTPASDAAIISEVPAASCVGEATTLEQTTASSVSEAQ